MFGAQHWIRDTGTDQGLLALEPLRSRVYTALREISGSTEAYPPLRVIAPEYLPGDPGCCPSQWRDTPYIWDAGSRSLVAGSSTTMRAEEYNADAIQLSLAAAQFFEVFR